MKYLIAVGDIEFQKKCLNRMEKVSQQGRTVLFVSHDLTSIAKLCTRGLVLSQGRLAMHSDAGGAYSIIGTMRGKMCA